MNTPLVSKHKQLGNKYPIPRVVAIDVDDTLASNGVLNQPLVDWLRKIKAEGFYLILWSMSGMNYAYQVAFHFKVADLFDVIISKPGYIVDDKGWTWIKYTKTINKETDI